MSALDAPAHRTDPGFAGWGWADIVQKVTTEAARRAAPLREDVTDAAWEGRIERAAQLLDNLIEGVCVAGVYPAFLLDHVEGIVPACLDAVDRVADWDEEAA